MVKNSPAMQETLVRFLVGKIRWRRDRLPTSVLLGFPGGSAGKETASNTGDLGSIPGFGRSPGEEKGYPLQYSGWRIPWAVYCMGSQGVGHDWLDFTSQWELAVAVKCTQAALLGFLGHGAGTTGVPLSVLRANSGGVADSHSRGRWLHPRGWKEFHLP